jgi:hypothetical protein
MIQLYKIQLYKIVESYFITIVRLYNYFSYTSSCYGKCEVRNLTLSRKVEVKYFINETAHKPNILRFWVRV